MMTKNSLNFYQELGSFSHVHDILNDVHYKKLPEDWFVIVTDIKGSTVAIEAGRYKDVNVIGVSSIIAVNNACADTEIPYIFGGDGATIFIPPEKVAATKKALSMTQKKSREEFALTLRVSIIPVSKIYQEGSQIFVAKLKLSETGSIAMAKGNGLAVAEYLTKKSDIYELKDVSDFQDAHVGLECRWSPIKNKNGEMLTLIVQSADSNVSIYSDVLAAIYKIVPNLSVIDVDKLNIKFPPQHYFKEVQMKNTGAAKFFVYFLGLFFVAYQSIAITLMKMLKKNIIYLNDLTKNTDYIKFDDTLRMIIDITREQKNRILDLLASLHAQKKILYGTHSSSTALITCFVKSAKDHVHFVDGGSGGYALAAKHLKSMRAAMDNPPASST